MHDAVTSHLLHSSNEWVQGTLIYSILIFWLQHHDTRQESMLATLDLLIQPLQEDNSPRVIVGSSTLIEQQLQLHELDVSNPQQP